MLAPVFPMNLIEQEVSQERWIDIPEEVLEILYRWRPTPCTGRRTSRRPSAPPPASTTRTRASRPAGSHKPNTAVAQAWYNKQFGIKGYHRDRRRPVGERPRLRLRALGLECKVFMVRVSFDQKPFRKLMMQTWGAECIASPSTETQAGREILAEDPDTPGSLGIAISEAIEAAVTDPTGQDPLLPSAAC